MPRHDPHYPSAPRKTQVPATPTVVHYRTAGGSIPCRIRGAGWRPQTCFESDVTCPACLRFLGVAP